MLWSRRVSGRAEMSDQSIVQRGHRLSYRLLVSLGATLAIRFSFSKILRSRQVWKSAPQGPCTGHQLTTSRLDHGRASRGLECLIASQQSGSQIAVRIKIPGRSRRQDLDARPASAVNRRRVTLRGKAGQNSRTPRIHWTTMERTHSVKSAQDQAVSAEDSQHPNLCQEITQ